MLQDKLTARMILSIVGLVQVFDIFVHVASNQIEPLRIAGNIVIFAWLVALAFVGVAIRKSLTRVTLLALVAYLALNAIFLGVEGFTNQGETRTVMFLLVAVTTVLSAFYAFAYKNIEGRNT